MKQVYLSEPPDRNGSGLRRVTVSNHPVSSAGTSGQRGRPVVADDQKEEAWTALWRGLDALQDGARKLRRLSQEEPLLKARPDYPRARLGRSHADEVRDVLDDVARHLEEIRNLVPQALPTWAADSSDSNPPGVASGEAPQVMLTRIQTLGRLAASLKQEAFQPPPTLPPHAPPYLSEPPGHDLPGTKAILVSGGIESVVTALRNLLLGAANTRVSGG
jgi:hypothetical protein